MEGKTVSFENSTPLHPQWGKEEALLPRRFGRIKWFNCALTADEATDLLEKRGR